MRQATRNINDRLMRLFEQTGLGDQRINCDPLTLQLRRWHFRHVLFTAPTFELKEPFQGMRRLPPFLSPEERQLIQVQEQLSMLIDLQVENIRDSYDPLPYSDVDALWRRLVLVASVFAAEKGDKLGYLHEVDLHLSKILEEGGLANLERYVLAHGYIPAESEELDPAWRWR